MEIARKGNAVIKVHDNNGNTFEHENGLDMRVDGGHLVVTDGSKQVTQAVYAPGQWNRAELGR